MNGRAPEGMSIIRIILKECETPLSQIKNIIQNRMGLWFSIPAPRAVPVHHVGVAPGYVIGGPGYVYGGPGYGYGAPGYGYGTSVYGLGSHGYGLGSHGVGLGSPGVGLGFRV